MSLPKVDCPRRRDATNQHLKPNNACVVRRLRVPTVAQPTTEALIDVRIPNPSRHLIVPTRARDPAKHLIPKSTRCCAVFLDRGRWAVLVTKPSETPQPEPDLTRLRAIFVARRGGAQQTFEELAHASGLSRQTLLNISRGKYRGDLRTWLILARTWDVSLDELMGPVWKSAGGFSESPSAR